MFKKKKIIIIKSDIKKIYNRKKIFSLWTCILKNVKDSVIEFSLMTHAQLGIKTISAWLQNASGSMDRGIRKIVN